MTSSPARSNRFHALHRLEAFTRRARSGNGGLLIVTGEPGIGKTHLLRQLASSESEQMAVAWGAGTAWPGSEPFGVWAQILPILSRATRSDDIPGGPPRGTDTDPDGWRELVTRLIAPSGDYHVPVAPDGFARLQLFDDVRSTVRDSASKRPVLLVIDDLHLVHPSALDLLSFIVPSLTTMPTAVLVGVRSVAPGDGEPNAHQVRGLARQGGAVALSGLDEPETADLVAETLGEAATTTGVASAIHRRSGGNPLFALELARLVSGLEADAALAALDENVVPENVMAIVADRVRNLTDDATEVLEIAAVLGAEFRDRALRLVAGSVSTSTDVDRGIAQLVAASLIETDAGPDPTYRFAHGIVRDAVRAGIARERGRHIHRAVVDLVVGDDWPATLRPAAAELAHHLLESDIPDRHVRAAGQFADAARAEIAVHAYREAATHIDQAIALVGDTGRGGAELLIDRGTALFALGDVDEARSTFRAAADRARSSDAPIELARAALGMGSGETGFEVPLLDADQIDLLRSALDRLPDRAATWRARVAARLSVALTSIDEAARTALSEQALDLAEKSRDPATVAAVLAARCDVLAGPEHSELREQAATEVIRLARACPDPGLELLGHRLRLVARLELGDVLGALGDADDFSVLADRLGQPMVRWYTNLWRAMRLLLGGQSEAALAAADDAASEGASANSVNAELLVTTHRWMHAIQVGDTDRLRQIIAAFDDGDALPRATWAHASLAFAFAHLGRLNAARVQLDAIDDELRTSPHDSEWIPMVAQVAEAISLSGLHPLADWAYEALLPFRDRHIVEGIGAVMLGSVEHPLGQLAAARGEFDAAHDHFDRAVSANRRLGSPALVARSLHHAGAALNDPERLEAARQLYEELGWNRCVEQLDRLVPLDGSAVAAPAAHPDPAHPGAAARMTRDGEGWRVEFQHRTAHVPDSKGLRDLLVLIRRPHVEVAVLDLVVAPADRTYPTGALEEGTLGVETDLGPVLDERARVAYRTRIADLDAEIDDARTMADHVRRERAENERDSIVSELSAAYGLGGAPRRPGDPVERARTTVTSRIRYAIDRIERGHPPLGRHLRNTIVTGRYCSYRPETDVVWEW